MVTQSVRLPKDVKRLAEARAVAAGFRDVGEFVAQLIVGEAAGAPEGLIVRSDRALEKLLTSRIDGPFVDADAADFKRMRKKLRDRLSKEQKRRAKGRP
jgi:hypothetical protein